MVTCLEKLGRSEKSESYAILKLKGHKKSQRVASKIMFFKSLIITHYLGMKLMTAFKNIKIEQNQKVYCTY